jgi:hypothetical protein
MIFGAHIVVSSNDADADRDFMRDMLGFASEDAGGGWLIFALPPTELAVHPSDDVPGYDLLLMCDDLASEMRLLESKGVRCSAVDVARWGSITRIRLPGGGKLGLYEPRHLSPLTVQGD